MANVSGEVDIQRAKDLRKQVKDVQTPESKRILEATANRLELRGARKLSRVGRRRRRKAGSALDSALNASITR